jgi:hypothetical protein
MEEEQKSGEEAIKTLEAQARNKALLARKA